MAGRTCWRVTALSPDGYFLAFHGFDRKTWHLWQWELGWHKEKILKDQHNPPLTSPIKKSTVLLLEPHFNGNWNGRWCLAEIRVGIFWGKGCLLPSRAGKRAFVRWQLRWQATPLHLPSHHCCCQSSCWNQSRGWQFTSMESISCPVYPFFFKPLLCSTQLVFFLLIFLLLLLRRIRVPGEALLVERDHHLWTFDISFLSRNKVSLVWVLPVYSTAT